MSRIRFLLFFVSLSLTVQGQQIADSLFRPVIKDPSYAAGKGPLILLDEAHHNFHTSSGRFRPFCDFLTSDGYVVKGSTEKFAINALKPARILVIANALHPSNAEQWSLPTPSAFTDEEIAAVNAWVRDGGALFLIADHMPFPGSAEKMAAAFGFTFYNGFAFRKKTDPGGQDLFTNQNGLRVCALTNGRNESERVTSLQTFTGQAFKIPDSATPVVILDSTFYMAMPETAWRFDIASENLPADGLAQGAYMKYGEGRVVVFGEAAMFSAQRSGRTNVGMNAPTASQNPQFLLNVIHWLDRKID